MYRHLYAIPRPGAQRPAKVVQLEVRRQLRREAQQPRPPKPAA
jgi:hypothetical protein